MSERWSEAHENRKVVSDPKLEKKVIAIVAELNAKGIFPTTREVSNVYSGKALDDESLPTNFQDAILQGVLNPLRRQHKLHAKYWKMNQLIWKVPKSPVEK